MVLLTVDGRATGSRGLSLKEMGQLMVGLGADRLPRLADVSRVVTRRAHGVGPLSFTL